MKPNISRAVCRNFSQNPASVPSSPSQLSIEPVNQLYDKIKTLPYINKLMIMGAMEYFTRTE
jgi:hypothetical protein